ncbi:hypothetical protein LXL04_001963 [Taraxacum kok-saghyz]
MAELGPKTTELPPDILFSNILPRLPPKSLSRFKCVSKQWHSFLRPPRFLQMHILHAKNTQNEKYIFLPNTRPWDFRTIDCETPEDGFTTSRPFPFKVGLRQDISILSSVNGLVCVGIINYSSLDDKISHIILWNPVTNDQKMLPKYRSRRCYMTALHKYELYYSFSENDYKLIWISHRRNVRIYSLKSNKWRKIKSKSKLSSSDSVSYDIMSSVMSNEKFHFLRKFFVFEGGDEKVRLGNDERTRDFMGFLDLKGHAYFCVALIICKDEYDVIELFRKVGAGSDSEYYWERVTKEDSSISDDNSLRYMIKNDGLHLMRNGNWLMYSSCKEYIYVLDMKRRTKGTMRPSNIAFHPGGKFIETLVSPNQYNDIK